MCISNKTRVLVVQINQFCFSTSRKWVRASCAVEVGGVAKRVAAAFLSIQESIYTCQQNNKLLRCRYKLLIADEIMWNCFNSWKPILMAGQYLAGS